MLSAGHPAPVETSRSVVNDGFPEVDALFVTACMPGSGKTTGAASFRALPLSGDTEQHPKLAALDRS